MPHYGTRSFTVHSFNYLSNYSPCSSILATFIFPLFPCCFRVTLTHCFLSRWPHKASIWSVSDSILTVTRADIARYQHIVNIYELRNHCSCPLLLCDFISGFHNFLLSCLRHYLLHLRAHFMQALPVTEKFYTSTSWYFRLVTRRACLHCRYLIRTVISFFSKRFLQSYKLSARSEINNDEITWFVVSAGQSDS